MYQEVFGVALSPETAVCHQCDVPACCNPGHLFLDTKAGNIHDMDSKGRRGSRRGEDHPMSKLTLAEVEEIRVSGDSISALSRRYGVHRRSINRIKQGIKWAH